jgi:hypothetical protein
VPTIGPHTLETFVACVTVIICTILTVTCKAVDESLEYWKGHQYVPHQLHFAGDPLRGRDVGCC